MALSHKAGPGPSYDSVAVGVAAADNAPATRPDPRYDSVQVWRLQQPVRDATYLLVARAEYSQMEIFRYHPAR